MTESILSDSLPEQSTKGKGGYVEGTQLLTPKGWKNISQITITDRILQWKADRSMDFTSPVSVSSFVAPYTVVLKNHQGHFNQEVSPNQRVIYTRKGDNFVIPVLDVSAIRNKTTSDYINTGKIASEGAGLTIRDRLLIAIQADGYFLEPAKRTGERIGEVPVLFSFAKERKSNRLVELAAKAGFRLADRKVDSTGRQNWALYIPVSDPVLWPRDKKLASIADFDSVSALWCEEFIEEVALWDGHIVKENTDRITWRCIDKENAEYVQTIASLAGYRTHFSTKVDNRKETFSDVHSVQIAKHLNTTSHQSVKVSEDHTPKQVYSVQVPSGFLLIRKDGGVSVIGDGS